jgi:hypothetical protein
MLRFPLGCFGMYLLSHAEVILDGAVENSSVDVG